MLDERLAADAWTDAALDLLRTKGIDRVRVEVVAKQLGVTKGSFYWHFKDRDALLVRMLERWRSRATVLLIERLDRQIADPVARLRALLRLPLKGQRALLAADIELAIRLWGRSDERARVALADVDVIRLDYIARQLIEAGLAPEAAQARAVLAYSYQRVAASLIPNAATDLMRQCEDALLAPVATGLNGNVTLG